MEAAEEERYLRRLDAGLSALQLCDFVIAWVCVEDDGVSALQAPHADMSSGQSPC